MNREQKIIDELIEQLSEGLRKVFLDAIEDIKSSTKLNRLVEQIEAGNLSAAVAELNIAEEFLEPIRRELQSAYTKAGVVSSDLIQKKAPRAMNLIVRFGGSSPEAEAWVKENGGRLITEINATTRENVQGIIINGLAEGRNPRDVALDLVGRYSAQEGRRVGGVIGLTRTLTGYLETARRELSSDDPALLRNYLTRELRDRRYDAAVRKAIEQNRKISKKILDAATSSYSDRLLMFRGDMIGRTEAIRALNAARHESFRQLVAGGKLNESYISRRWRSAGFDGRTRDSHLAMHDQTVSGISEPFRSPLGSLMMFPGDTSLGAPGYDTINCRCYEEINVDYVRMQVARERGL